VAILQEGSGRPIWTSSGAITGRKFLKHLRWYGATTAGHTLVVKDTAGNTLWESESDGPHFIDVHPFYVVVDGINVVTIDSGKMQAFYG
jgi:hypothetical protein